MIRKLFEEWDVELLIQGLHYCSEKELYSAGELKSSIIYLEQLKTVGDVMSYVESHKA